jgi:hypothetical protein
MDCDRDRYHYHGGDSNSNDLSRIQSAVVNAQCFIMLITHRYLDKCRDASTAHESSTSTDSSTSVNTALHAHIGESAHTLQPIVIASTELCSHELEFAVSSARHKIIPLILSEDLTDDKHDSWDGNMQWMLRGRRRLDISQFEIVSTQVDELVEYINCTIRPLHTGLADLRRDADLDHMASKEGIP